jgi:hypothetical protein
MKRLKIRDEEPIALQLPHESVRFERHGGILEHAPGVEHADASAGEDEAVILSIVGNVHGLAIENVLLEQPRLLAAVVQVLRVGCGCLSRCHGGQCEHHNHYRRDDIRCSEHRFLLSLVLNLVIRRIAAEWGHPCAGDPASSGYHIRGILS